MKGGVLVKNKILVLGVEPESELKVVLREIIVKCELINFISEF